MTAGNSPRDTSVDTSVDLIGLRGLAHLWQEQVEQHPDHPWLVFEDAAGKVVEHTYAEFDRAVAAVATGLLDHGVRPGDAVVLHLRNCPEFVMTWFALARIGAILVPSNIANTRRELHFIAERSEAAAIVVDAEFAAVAAPVADTLPTCRALFVARVSAVPDGLAGTPVAFDVLRGTPPRPVDGLPGPDDVLQILFTSGTTATPKGVVATHANALWAGESGSRGQGIDRNDRCLTALPLFHVNGQAITVLSSLTVGATVVLLEEFVPARYFDAIRRHRATQTSVVAQQALALLREPARDDDRDHALRRVGFAINISTEAKDEFERRFGVEFINIYGLSEAMAVVTMSPLHRPQRWPSVGLPALTRAVRIVDPAGDDLPVGQIGEILVHGIPGRTIMRNYWNDPDATEAVLQNGWIRTGDAGYLDEHGYVYYYERLKDVIKCSGQNVSASEVEAVLDLHPDIAESAVIGVPDERRGETVKAFVVTTAPLTSDDVVAHCAEHLSRYKLPQYVEFLDTLPRTSIGKLAKGELRKRT